MKINITLEKSDLIEMITRHLASKSLVADPTSFVVRVRMTSEVPAVSNSIDAMEVEIDVQVDAGGPGSGPEFADHAAVPSRLPMPPVSVDPAPRPIDLLDEAPDPGTREVGIGELASASRAIAQTKPGMFAPDRVTRRPMMDGESTEYPGLPRQGGR